METIPKNDAATPVSLRLDEASGTVWKGNTPITLRAKTLGVLRHLALRAGEVVSRDELREVVWGKRHGSEHGPKQCIRELRTRLATSAEEPLIETVGRHGYRLVGQVTVVGTTSDAAPPARFRSAFACVGRDNEIDDLLSGLERTRRGARSTYLVSGDTGAGKTTLVENFLARLEGRDDVWIAEGLCSPHHGPREPYGPLLDMAGRLARGPMGASFIQSIRTSAPTWLTQLPGVFTDREMVDKQTELIGGGPERMQRELTEVLERLTQRRPGVIVIEDLQWTDTRTADWLCSWALRRAPARLMIVGTYRSDEGLDDAALRTLSRELHRSTGFRRIALGGLGTEAIANYLDARFPSNAFPAELAALVAQRTEGHPIFVVALVEEWLARGDLHRLDGRWQLRGKIADRAKAIPSSARVLIEHLFTRLTTRERRLLDMASAAGPEFSAAVLESDAVSPEDIERQCEELARRGLFIHRSGSASWPNETVAASYAFRHALYQQVLYDHLPPATRRALHRKIGLRLETAYDGHTREIAAVMANHFEQAKDRLRSARYWRQAGNTAIRRGAVQEAVTQLKRSLELLQSLPQDRARLEEELPTQMGLAEGLRLTEGYRSPFVLAAYRRARQLCDELSDSATLAPAVLGHWYHYNAASDFAGMTAVVQELQRLADTSGDPALFMAAHNMAGQTHWFGGELVEAQPHIDAVVAVYDVQRHGHLSLSYRNDPGIACRMCACILSQMLGADETSERHFDAGVAIASALNRPSFDTGKILWAGAIAARERGDAVTVRERTLELIEICERSSINFWLPTAYALAGWAAVALGGTDIETVRTGVDGLPSAGSAVITPYRLAVLADTCGLLGRPEQGLEAIERALGIVSISGSRWYEAELYRLKGMLTLGIAREGLDESLRAGAIRDLRHALAIAQQQQARHFERRISANLAEVHD